MAINLNTLTSPATSGDVLAEALTTADFLEGVPVLRNLARGSQKGGDAKQDVALNQPKALPLIKNPAGNLGGYLYIPNVAGNYATGPSVTIGSNQTWEAEVDMVITQFGNNLTPFGGGDWSAGFGMLFYHDGSVRLFSKGTGGSPVASGVTLGTAFSAKYGYDGTNIFVDIDGSRKYTGTAGQSGSITHNLELNQQAGITNVGNYAIQKAKLTVNNAVVFDCDFNGSTSIRHGDTKFQAAVGGPVTINQSGNDPSTIIKKPVLRFDGADDFMKGVFNQTIDGGYMFAAFSVLGDGGGASGRLFGINSTGANDNAAGGYFVARDGAFSHIMMRYNGGTNIRIHDDVFDDALGDIFFKSKFQNSSQISKVNNANEANGTTTVSGDLSAEEFTIAAFTQGYSNASLDLEYLALFPATITDAQADDVRNYINNRNNVFSLIDSQGYYFFDGAATSANQVFTGSSSWPGRIVGSDNDDIFKYLSNPTHNDRPTTDGYKINFADNSDHFLFNTPLTGGQAGWQIVGTSLGTFAYRVDSDAVTELNLLGNAGTVRSIGDLYGIILLPASATGKDIEDARKLLIDRGAADAASVTSVEEFWRNRSDIVEFNHVNFTNVTNFLRAWRDANSINNFGAINAPNGNNFSGAWEGCDSLLSFPAGAKLGTSANNVNFTSTWQENGLTSFPALDLSKGINMSYAWYNATSLSSFGAIDARGCTNFFNAWNGCSSLTSFPAGAKLGTAANNVNFTSAWNSSGLTSFPALDLSTGNNFANSFISSDLTSFPDGIKMGTAATGDVQFTDTWRDTTLSSFPALDLGNGKFFNGAWRDCHELTSFPSDIKLGTNKTGVGFSDAWRGSGLTSFSTPLPKATALVNAFRQCTSLTSFDLDEIPLATNCQLAWYQNSALTSFSTKLPKCGLFNAAWYNCSALTNFSAGVFSNWNPSSITSGVFNNTWDGCTSLTAQSVENILTSIDASGKYATSTGASGGSALADAGIDIDYNVATGTPAYSTLASLKAKGWSIIVNNVTL